MDLPVSSKLVVTASVYVISLNCLIIIHVLGVMIGMIQNDISGKRVSDDKPDECMMQTT